nr:immunoglobulin heavy chain junction region [Mus musculus]MBK4197084.1 immunoglobulin heavy chain junction region [Mus musculus]
CARFTTDWYFDVW